MIVFLAVFASCLAVVAAVIGFVDPYNRFGRHPDVARRLGTKTNHVLLAMIETAKIPTSVRDRAGVVIIGDSRARKLTPDRVFEIAGQPALNLGIGGASIEEMLTWLDEQAPRLPALHVLIVATPFERFSAAPGNNAALEAFPLAQHPFRYLLNAKILQQSIELLRQPALKPPEPSAARAPSAVAQADASVRATWRRLFSGYQPALADLRLAALRTRAATLRDRGVQIVFWAPPLRSDVGGFIAQLGLEAEHGRVFRELREIAPLIDMTHATSVHDAPLVFSDPVHNDNGTAILADLLAATSGR